MKGSHAKRKKKKCPSKSLQTINPSRDSASCNNNDDDDDESKQATTQKKNRNKQNKTKQNQSAQNQRQKTHSNNTTFLQCNAMRTQNQTKL